MRRLLVLLTAALLLVTTAACGGDSGSKDKAEGTSIKGLTVGGSFGQDPSVKIKPAVNVTEATTQVVSKGDGDPVKTGGKALLNVYIANGKTGKKALSTYDQGKPISAQMDESQFFPSIVRALQGKSTGSRVAVADTVKDLYGAAGASQLGLKAKDTLVFVVDIMSVQADKVLDGPQGQQVDPPAGAPKIVEKGGTITGLDFKGAAKPTGKLQVIPLVKGKGEKIDGAKIVTVDYLGQVFGGKKPFNNSYPQQPVPFDVGIGGLIKAWDTALEGQRVGSRVMLIVPPAQGYGKQGNPSIKVSGKDTMVFVMDVLGVG